MTKAELVRAAFRGLAEGIFGGDTSDSAPPVKVKRRPSTKPRSSRQLPLSPQMQDNLSKTFDGVQPNMDDYETPSIQELEAIFQGQGSEALEQLRNQMRMQRQSATVNPPPPKPNEERIVYPAGMNDQ